MKSYFRELIRRLERYRSWKTLQTRVSSGSSTIRNSSFFFFFFFFLPSQLSVTIVWCFHFKVDSVSVCRERVSRCSRNPLAFYKRKRVAVTFVRCSLENLTLPRAAARGLFASVSRSSEWWRDHWLCMNFSLKLSKLYNQQTLFRFLLSKK